MTQCGLHPGRQTGQLRLHLGHASSTGDIYIEWRAQWGECRAQWESEELSEESESRIY